MNWIKKLIPAYVEVRSLYWVRREREMHRCLSEIFDAIDQDDLRSAKALIVEFENKFTQSGVPHFVAIKYAEIYRATSMVHFLGNND